MDVCPKCGTDRAAAATACAKCGLSVDRMEGFAASRDAALPDALGAAWDLALEGWTEPVRHDEVMRLVARHDAYAWAAARYRTKAGDPIADKQLERIRRAAEVTLLATAASRKDKGKNPYRATTTMLIALVVLIVGGLIYAMAVKLRSDNQPTPPGELR